MNARVLVSYPLERSVLLIRLKNGYSVAFQAVASIKKTSVRAEMDVGAFTCEQIIGLNCLNCVQVTVFITENCDFTRELPDDIAIPAVIAESDMAWPAVRTYR